jgi:hypothetical protein
MPDIIRRRAVAGSLSDCMTDLHVGSSSGKHWGKSDYGLFGPCEGCLMYYTIAGMNDEIESTLCRKLTALVYIHPVSFVQIAPL